MILKSEECEPVKADICARPDGVHKAALMRTLYRSNPSFLPLFSLLTHWARGLGIIRSASLEADSGRCSGDSQVLMKSGFLHALIIHILQIMESDEDEREMERERRENSRVRRRKRDIGVQDEYDLIGLDDEENDDTEDEEENHDDNDNDNDNDDDDEGEGGEEEGMPSIMSKSLSKACAHHTDNDRPHNVPDFDYLAHANECSPLHLARLMVTFFRFGSQLKDEFCFEWPVPGRPEHRLDTAIIADFAEHCARSYQTLAYSGSWTSILDQSGYLDDLSFSLELPESITDMLSRNAFMALKLQTLSKARSVSIVLIDKRYWIMAQGTRREIQNLRAQISMMLRLKRFGRVATNIGVYFMEGGQYMHVKNTSGTTAYVRFLDDSSPCSQGKHQNEERSYAVRSEDENDDDDTAETQTQTSDWKDVYTQGLIEKIHEQLRKLDDKEPWESMKLRISYGRHYFICARLAMGHSSYSVDDVLMTLKNSVYNRMTYRRPDYNPDSLPLRFGIDSSVIESKDSETDSNWKYNEDKSRNRECDHDNDSNKDKENGLDSARTDTQSITENDSNNSRMKLNKSIQDAKDKNKDEGEEEGVWNEVLNPVEQDVHDEDGEGEGELSSDSATATSASKKNKKKGMTHSFNNSIYSTSSSPNDYTSDADVGLAIFGNTVLRDVGYTEKSRWVPSYSPTVYSAEESKEDNENEREENKEGEKEEEKEVENDKDGCVWEVTIIASASYVVHVSLSSDLRVIKAAEKTLAWVNSTLLAGTDRDRKKEKNSAPGGLTKPHVPQDLLESDPLDIKKDILRTHDIRTRLTSEKKLYPGDALYDAVCPDGRAPIEIDPTTQLPKSSEFLLEGYRVIFARKLHDRTFYEYTDKECSDDDYKLQCTIRVSRSTHYEGEDGNLNNELLISDVNLKINIDPLIAFHQFPEDHSTPNAQGKINRFLSRAITHSLLLSDRIEAAHNTV